MTGPEHYAKAQEYLALTHGAPGSNPNVVGTLMAAQTHATLALAAAVITGLGQTGSDVTAWRRMVDS